MLLHEWKEANNRAVAQRYPQFEIIEPPSGSNVIQAWAGIIVPFESDQELGAIFEDLEEERAIFIKVGGVLTHDPACRCSHGRPRYMDRVQPAHASFKLNVFAFPEKQHPRAYSVGPRISRDKYPMHPHLQADSAACPYLPSDNVWRWGSNTVADFLDFGAIWLAKHVLWEQTGACRGGGIWIGPSSRHSPRELLMRVGRNEECPCASGKKYKRCCQSLHQAYVRSESERPMVLE